MASLSVSELRLGCESVYIVVELQLKSSVYTIERAAQYSFCVLHNSVGSLMLMGESPHCTNHCWGRINCLSEYTVACKMFSLVAVTEALGKVTGWTTAISLQLAHYSNTVILLANQVAKEIIPSSKVESPIFFID